MYDKVLPRLRRCGRRFRGLEQGGSHGEKMGDWSDDKRDRFHRHQLRHQPHEAFPQGTIRMALYCSSIQ